ncbi:MAG: hypothetical protein KBT27_15255 [Prevotellaceae bacterium]|nr:hypothetical protein [Candidatus Faecinaster equi]
MAKKYLDQAGLSYFWSKLKAILADKEDKGKITVNGTAHTVERKTLTITNNGVTTTYYIADIT